MKKIILVIVVIVVVVGALLWLKKGESTPSTNNSQSAAALELTETYRHETARFSLKYPKGFEVSTLPVSENTGEIIIIQDQKQGLGMQITLSSFEENLSVLTAERIKQDVPDLEILESQEVIIGNDGKGIAFFDGTGTEAMRQIWFVARGYLYQITSSKSFDNTLKAMMNTWVFE